MSNPIKLLSLAAGKVTKNRLSFTALIFAGLLVTLSTGCGEKPLSGSITVNGNGVPGGLLMFVPDINQGNDGPTSYATVKDGQFLVSEGTRAPGPNKVRLTVAAQWVNSNFTEFPAGDPGSFTIITGTCDLPADESAFDVELEHQAAPKR